MKLHVRSEFHGQILKKYPMAMTLINVAIENGEIKEGEALINHPDIPPTIVTKEMLERGFPSLQESFYFYITEPKL